LSNPKNTFRDRSRDNQEYVIAEAKLRYVIILYLATPHDLSVSVIPVYSFADHKNSAFLEAVRQSRPPDKVYLPPDSDLGIRESYADLRHFQEDNCPTSLSVDCQIQARSAGFGDPAGAVGVV